MKNVFIFLLFLVSSVTVVSAGTTSVNMNIRLKLAYPSCNINNGQGFSQNVSLESISKGLLMANRSITPKVVPIIIDCSGGTDAPDNFYISMSQIAPIGEATLLAQGKLKTTKDGVGVQLTWAHSGNVVSIVNGADMRLKGSSNVSQTGLIFDASMKALPVTLPGVNAANIQPGSYSTTLNITLSYK